MNTIVAAGAADHQLSGPTAPCGTTRYADCEQSTATSALPRAVKACDSSDGSQTFEAATTIVPVAEKISTAGALTKSVTASERKTNVAQFHSESALSAHEALRSDGSIGCPVTTRNDDQEQCWSATDIDTMLGNQMAVSASAFFELNQGRITKETLTERLRDARDRGSHLFIVWVRYHWVLAEWRDELLFYDSAVSQAVRRDLTRWAADLGLPAPKFPPVPQQHTHSNECGIFATLFAMLRLAQMTIPPCSLKVSLHELRSHAKNRNAFYLRGLELLGIAPSSAIIGGSLQSDATKWATISHRQETAAADENLCFLLMANALLAVVRITTCQLRLFADRPRNWGLRLANTTTFLTRLLSSAARMLLSTGVTRNLTRRLGSLALRSSDPICLVSWSGRILSTSVSQPSSQQQELTLNRVSPVSASEPDSRASLAQRAQRRATGLQHSYPLRQRLRFTLSAHRT